MTEESDELVKKGVFNSVSYSSSKTRTCKEGELVLTTDKLLINCGGRWTKTFPVMDIILEAGDDHIEIRNFVRGRLLFKLIVDSPLEWKEALDKVLMEKSSEAYLRFHKLAEKRPEELRRLLHLDPERLRKLYDNTREEKLRYEAKNIRFNLDIQRLWWSDKVKNRKLKAFIVAHSYVAWYEWTKKLLYKIYKARQGKGPTSDGELMKFLNDFPSLKMYLDTSKWGMEANQLRNSVSHEKFYFDYKKSELVFMGREEKRVRLRELTSEIFAMAHFYSLLLKSLEEKATKGKISYESEFM